MIDFSLLDPQFSSLAQQLIANCAKRGVRMVPYFGLRTPLEQAKIWRQSRAGSEISNAITGFRNEGCDFLADCLEKAGPCNGPWATNALPGFSTHNYGWAMDCYWVDSETTQVHWSGEGYNVYQEEAKLLGLYQAFLDPTKDIGHVQLVPPTYNFGTNAEVDAKMKAKFG